MDNAKIVKGFNLGDGEYVMLSDDELDGRRPGALPQHRHPGLRRRGRHRPSLLPVRYYLAPQGEGARRAYALLREAMEKEGKVAVASSSCATRSTW